MVWFDLICSVLIWSDSIYLFLFYSIPVLLYSNLFYSNLFYLIQPYSILFYSMRVCCIILEGLLPSMQQLPFANSKIDRTCVQQPFSMKLIRGRDNRGHTLNKVRISVEVQRSRGKKFLKKRNLSIYTWREGLEIGSVILRLPHRLLFW